MSYVYIVLFLWGKDVEEGLQPFYCISLNMSEDSLFCHSDLF